MMTNLLIFPNKRLRTEAIKEYISTANYNGVVCISCGNATKELKAAGINTIDISPLGVFSTNEWLCHRRISEMFPSYFDATSGHLPLDLMYKVGEKFRQYLGELSESTYYIPTGSGETIFCLKLAYPDKDFVAVYNMDDATKYDKENPFNAVVKMCAKEIIGV